ncbi:VirK/YbjX family protein [Pasteurella multocida]|uniref:VirK/YbjX family protein n=1 Tax=Pasteurella multocida TaxID=747 RepID=UPI00397C32F1
MQPAFSFPNFSQMYPHEKRKLKRFREYLRYQYAYRLHYKQCKRFDAFLNQYPLWIPLFQQQPYRVNSLLSTYCNRRWGGTQRLQAIITNLTVAANKFGVESCQRLLAEGAIRLATLTESLSLNLNINMIDPFEGFFSLNIQNTETQQSVYDASFTFLSENELLIASIQGPKGEQAQDVVRAVTKQLHGVRPMFMLVNGFCFLAQQLNCQLLGIPHRQQAKYRWNDSARLLFNYDEFWQENEAVKQGEYWCLPTEVERKPLEDIQSKKRSMYRKRYDMFDSVLEQCSAQLS